MEEVVMKKYVLCVCCYVFILSLSASAWGLTWGKGAYRIGGYYENLTGIRLNSGPNGEDLNNSRNSFQLECDFAFTPNVSFFGIVRGYYDAAWEFDSDIPDATRNMTAVPFGEGMESDVYFREYYLTLSWDRLTVKIGRQQVIWGESDAIRMADIINPLDLSWRWSTEAWEDIRIPLRMINVIYNFSSTKLIREPRLQFIYIPEHYQTISFAPSAGSVFHPIFGPVSGSDPAPWTIRSVAKIQWSQQRLEMPDRSSSDNNEFGVKVTGTIKGAELGLFYFYNRVDGFVVKFDPTHAPLPVAFKWPFVNTFGGTINYFDQNTGVVYRFECAYNRNHPYTQANLLDIKDRDTFAFMLGFDRPTMLRSLNPRRAFFISGQWFHKHILDYDSNISTLDMDDDHYQNIMSLLINTWYLEDRIQPEILAVYDFSNNGFIRPQLLWDYSDYVSIAIGFQFFYGHNDADGYFGAVRANDEFYWRVRIKF